MKQRPLDLNIGATCLKKSPEKWCVSASEVWILQMGINPSEILTCHRAWGFKQ
jgi:hypothetical protein